MYISIKPNNKVNTKNYNLVTKYIVIKENC